MQILNKKLTKNEFLTYITNKNFGTIPPTKMVIHHTWKPTLETWNGQASINGLKNYYEGLGWPVGPHIFIAPDGIWLFTDMNEVGIHAGAGNATWTKNGRDYTGYSYRGAKLKDYSIGIEVVGDYDEKVWEGEILEQALFVITTLKRRLGITLQDVKFHRDFSPKTCPGNAITRNWFEKKVQEYESGITPKEGYEFKFSEIEARKAMKLGFLKQVDTETREIIAIGLTRVYERIKKEFGNR
jgi:N-acetylmuramoyl-L-alanine amidase CwlA